MIGPKGRKMLNLNNKASKASVAILLCGSSLIAAPAFAQSAPADESAQAAESGPAEGEIIVTAQKRSQRLTDVGITIAAATGDQLKTAGVVDVGQLANIVPGFSATTTSNGFPVYSLRGVNFNASQASAAPAVSVYVDQGALPFSVMTGGIFLDVERVEVLKGPQGTLFGQNATGGSINIIAAKPTSTLKAGFSTEVNHFGQVMLEGYVSGPLSDTLRARVAASTTQFGAWQRGYYLNRQKNGDQNKGAARLLLDWTPTDRLTVAVNLNANYDHGEVQQGQIAYLTIAVPGGEPPLLNTYQSRIPAKNNRYSDFDLGFDTHARNRTLQGVLRADYELTDDLTFTSLTDYVDTNFASPRDLDGSAVSQITGTASAKLSVFNQEVRLSGKFPSAGINFILGANYQHDDITDRQDNIYQGYSGLAPGTTNVIDYKFKNKTFGVFGNLDFEILPRLTLTGGLRYTRTKQSVSGCTYDGGNGFLAGTGEFIANLFRSSAGLPPAPAGAYAPGGCIVANDVGPNPDYLPVVVGLRQTEDNYSWRAGVNYKPTPDTLVYALVSRGYKAGGFPAQFTLLASQTDSFKQEELTSYEIGAKLSAFDRKLQANISAFHYDYKNKQFFTYVPVGGFITVATIKNIPSSKVKGFDFDVTARPIVGFTLRGALTYVKTEIGDYAGFDYTGTPVNFKGSPFTFAPPVSATLDAEYRTPVNSDLEGFVGGGLLYNSKTYADFGKPLKYTIDPYTTFNARIGIESSKGWRVSLWARNLTNKYYWNSVTSGGDEAIRITGQPRTFGASAGFTF